MAAPDLVLEHALSLDFDGSYAILSMKVYDTRARPLSAHVRKELGKEKFLDRPVLLVWDRGMVGREPEHAIEIVAVRRFKEVTPIPNICGRFLGRVPLPEDEFWIFEKAAAREKTTEKEPPAPKPEADPWPL